MNRGVRLSGSGSAGALLVLVALGLVIFGSNTAQAFGAVTLIIIAAVILVDLLSPYAQRERFRIRGRAGVRSWADRRKDANDEQQARR